MAAQARKVDALKTHKKGLMQQLFPREGETQPRLRFPEFKSEWNNASLGDLCITVSSGKDARDSDGAFDLYGSTGVIGKTAKASYDTPHILVARVGANAGHLTKASGQFGVTDNTLVIRLKPAAGIDYIFHYLGNLNINKLIFGSGQPLITGSILKAQRVLLPSASEQRKISNCLSSIDDLINAESDKLEAFKAYKSGLMQELFPSPNVHT
jgi:type I restriction enzyme S subunit